MTVKQDIQSYFQTNDRPSQEEFELLISRCYNDIRYSIPAGDNIFNLFSPDNAVGQSLNTSTGGLFSSGANTSHPMNVDENSTIVTSGIGTYIFYDIKGEVLQSGVYSSPATRVIQSPPKSVTLRVTTWASTWTDMMITYGDQAVPFKPYTGDLKISLNDIDGIESLIELVELIRSELGDKEDEQPAFDEIRLLKIATESLSNSISNLGDILISLERSSDPNSPVFVRFDNGSLGGLGLKFDFDRPVATRSPLGREIEAGQPRFDVRSGFCESVVDQISTVIPSNSQGQVFLSGFLADGETPIALHLISNLNRIDVYLSDLDLNSRVSSTVYPSYDISNGSVPNTRYIPIGGTIAHGLIAILCQRLVNNNGDGVSLAYSTDLGESWAISDVPNRSSGDFGTLFGLQNYWVTNGQTENPTEVWIAFTDYQRQLANGGQAALMRFSRSSGGSSDWVTDGLRVIYQQNNRSGVHFHCIGVCERDNKLQAIVSRGDATDNNATILCEIDISSGRSAYMTAPITTNISFHGGDRNDANVTGLGKRGHQFTGIAPSGIPCKFLVTSDFNPEVISSIQIPEGDAATAVAEVNHVFGNRSFENFSIMVDRSENPTGWLSSDGDKDADHAFIYYSSDGLAWNVIYKKPGSLTYPTFFGDLICFVQPGVGVMSLPIPEAISANPLLIGPGSRNRSGEISPWTPPRPGAMIEKVEPNAEGLYEYPEGHRKAGQVLPSQPQSYGEVWRFRADGLQGSAGLYYLDTASSVMDNGPDNYCAEVFSLDNQGTEMFIVFDGSSGHTPYIDSVINNNWVLIHGFGDLRGNNRPSFSLLPRSGPNVKEVDAYITFTSHGVGGDTNMGYPVPRVTDYTGINEIAKLSDVDLQGNWEIISKMAMTRYGTQSESYDSPIVCIKSNNTSDYIEVYRSSFTEVTLRMVKSGVSTQAPVAITGMIEDFQFETRVKRDGTNTVLEMLVNGEAARSVSLSNFLPDDNYEIMIGSNVDGSKVGIWKVFAVGYN